jgi:hypothetical protein
MIDASYALAGAFTGFVVGLMVEISISGGFYRNMISAAALSVILGSAKNVLIEACLSA